MQLILGNGKDLSPSLVLAFLVQMYDHQACGVMVLEWPARELFRSPLAHRMMSTWFPQQARELPEPVLRRAGTLFLSRERDAEVVPFWIEVGDTMDLVVRFSRLVSVQHEAVLGVVLQEVPHRTEPPRIWKALLTPREFEVAGHMLRGCTNEVIADACGCRVKTVKKHVQHIFDKLGVSNRTSLCHLAMRRM